MIAAAFQLWLMTLAIDAINGHGPTVEPLNNGRFGTSNFGIILLL